MPWHFVICETDGHAIGELANARGRTLTWYLNDAATVAFTMDGIDPHAAMIDELSTDLLVYDPSSALRFRGRMGSSSDDVSISGHVSTFAAVDYRGVLARRLIWPGATIAFPENDQADIAWQLIADSQAQIGGNLGITRNAPATGRIRQRNYALGDNIGSMLLELGNVIDGFDWEIDGNLSFNMFYPERGGARGALTYGDNVVQVTRTVDTSLFANAVRFVGVDTLVPSIALASSFGAPGRWEMQQGDTTILDQSTSDAKALYYLSLDSVIDPTYSLTLRRGWWDPSLMWLGDTVALNIYSGRLRVNTEGRITSVALSIGDEADEDTVVITIGPVITDYVKRLLEYNQRLVALEKH